MVKDACQSALILGLATSGEVAEIQVTVRFWIVSAIFALLGILLLKIR